MKRFIALLLCLLLVVLPLVACDNSNPEEPGNDNVARPNLTLKFAIVVDDRTEKEGIQAMSDQFNAYTMQKYSTAVDFYCYTADEYKAKMDEIMNGIKTDKPAKDVQDRVNPNENIPVREEYPDARVDQFDLVVMLDEAMYLEYAELGYITSISSYLSGTYKDIKTMIHTTVMNESLVPSYDFDGNVIATDYYGIPASKPIGSYKYLAVNKKALDYYNFNTAEITDFTFAYRFWSTIAADVETGFGYWAEQYADKSFAPILNSAEDFLYPNVKYLSQDGGESIFGLLYEPKSSVASWNPDLDILTPKNLLTDIKYTSYLKLRQQANAQNAFGTGAESEYLLGIVEGPFNMRNADEDYYYCPLNMPSLERENVFSGMLAVSAFTVNAGRSVEMILGLMTDSTMMNLLLYGVDTNYMKDSDGVISFRVSSNYALDYDYAVGNLIALATPCADYGQTADYYAGARLQNLETNKKLFTDDFGTYTAKFNAEKWALMDAAAADYMAELAACADTDALVAKIAEINAELTLTAEMGEDDIAYIVDWMIGDFGLDINGTMSMHVYEYFVYRLSN